MIDYGYGVRLRRLDGEDTFTIFDARNDPKVYHWCRQYGPLHIGAHAKWLDWQVSDPKTEMFGIEAVLDGKVVLVGVCGLTDVDMVNGRAEFSLYIIPKYNLRGYGSQALSSLLEWGFNAKRLNRIWGEVFDGNPALNMFLSLGFEKEGVRREFYFRNGHYVDAHLISIGAAMFHHPKPKKTDSPSSEGEYGWLGDAKAT